MRVPFLDFADEIRKSIAIDGYVTAKFALKEVLGNAKHQRFVWGCALLCRFFKIVLGKYPKRDDV